MIGGIDIPVSKPKPARLSSEAAKLLAGLTTQDADQRGPWFEKFLREIATTPSRPGAEVLAFMGGTYAESNPELAELALKASTSITQACDRDEWITRLQETVAKLVEASRADGYAKGWAAGRQLVEDETQPVERTEFESDPKTGQILAKVVYSTRRPRAEAGRQGEAST
jgi:hypothetical protein